MQDPKDLIRLSTAARKLFAKPEPSETGHELTAGIHGLDLMVVFSGHLDAGNVSTQLRNALLERLDHELIATFDTDQLIDYRARRPQIRFDGQQFADYEAPELQLHVVKDQLQQPFLLLSGPEPDYQWDRFVGSVLLLVAELEVELLTFLDAVPLPVPHTRPLGVTTHGTAQELLEGLATWSPEGRVAAGAAQLLELRAAEEGRRVSGYTLHVPHYLADATYPQAAVAALEYAGVAMNRLLPTEELRESGRVIEQQIAAQASNRPEVAAMLQQLEERFDEHAKDHQTRSLLLPPDQRIPDAEEIGSAVESYLTAHSEATLAAWEHGAEADDLSALPSADETLAQTDPLRPSRARGQVQPDALDPASEAGQQLEDCEDTAESDEA